MPAISLRGGAALVGCVALAALAGCGPVEVAVRPGGVGGSSAGGGPTGSGGDLFTIGSATTGGGPGGPCDGVSCDADEHCEVVDELAVCVGNSCDDLVCSSTEVCQPTEGGGAICVDVSCSDDVECPASQHCNGAICVDDVCVASATRCEAGALYECSFNGAAEVLKYTCGSAAYFVSACVDDGQGDAHCSCEDDWDCPPDTRCEARRCVGTGKPPTCFLEPQPFAGALPTPEITWGGTGLGAEQAVGSAFAGSSQVVLTPVVANLDDDNGDGKIDERDFPEIIFTTFCHDGGANRFRRDGVLRAIHGGGPQKGQDFFASCGTTLWSEGDDPGAVSCSCTAADLDSTASLAVGDLNDDGVPEIVTITEGDGANAGAVRIYSNRGVILHEGPQVDLRGDNPAPSIANVDGEGPAEIIVGRNVFTVRDVAGVPQVLDRFEGTRHDGTNGQGPASCVADLLGDARLEIIGGTTVYRFPVPPPGAQQRSDCNGSEVGEAAQWCLGRLVEIYDAAVVNSGVGSEGFCAVADVWGADRGQAPGPNNPLDGAPELLTITSGFIQVFAGQTGQLIDRRSLSAGGNGGPPNVDDFDGDGFPEVGTAAEVAYVVVDFQQPTVGGACNAWANTPSSDSVSVASVNTPRTPPAAPCDADADCGDTSRFACNEQTRACVCLHNGWRRATEDDSSRVTGSSVFDFNGDGAAEVVYNDECRFRIYDGLDGHVYLREPSESRTRIEYPVIADVDNDGNAEIVFSTTNESGFCSENLDGQYNNGIEVWGDQNDHWVSARRIWNQHTYHVTNVTEDGRVPARAPESWGDYHGRRYNTFRSNPRTRGIAPDLSPTAVQISSPDSTCGVLSDDVQIVVQVRNLGDVRVGPGVVIGFHGTWDALALDEPLYAADGVTPLTEVLVTSLEPGEAIFVTVGYDAANNAAGVLPDTLTVVVDETALERECDETNNERQVPVEAGDPLPDLRVVVANVQTVPQCPIVTTTVLNVGSASASEVVVRFFQGDPDQGGAPLHDELLAGPIDPGDSETFSVFLPGLPTAVPVILWAVVDPDDAILECNDGNNRDSAPEAVTCGTIN